MQNKNNIVVANPRTPVATTLVRIPRPATTLSNLVNVHYDCEQRLTYLACFVSSAMWPEASNPIMVPELNKLKQEVRYTSTLAA